MQTIDTVGSSELMSLHRQNVLLTERCRDLERELQNSKASVHVSVQKMDEQRRVLDEVDKRRVSVMDSKLKLEEEIFLLRHEVETWKAERQRVQAERDELSALLRNANSNAEAKMSNLSLENEKLRSMLQKRNQEIVKFKDEVNMKSKELASSTVTKVKLEHHVGKLQAQLNASHSESSKVSQEKYLMKKSYSVQQGSMHDVIQTLKDELSMTEGKLLSLERQYELQRESNQTLKMEIEQKEAEILQQQILLKELESKQDQAEKIRQQKVEQLLKETEDRIEALTRQSEMNSAHQSAAFIEQQKRIEDLSHRLLSAQARNQELEQAMREAEQHHSELESKWALAEQMQANSLEKIKNQATLLDQAKVDGKRLREQLASEKAKGEQQIFQIKELQSEIDLLRRDLAEANDNHRAVSKEKIKLQGENSNLQNKLKFVEDRLSNAEHEHESLHGQLMEQSAKVHRLQLELDTARQKEQQFERLLQKADKEKLSFSELQASKIEALEAEKVQMLQQHSQERSRLQKELEKAQSELTKMQQRFQQFESNSQQRLQEQQVQLQREWEEKLAAEVAANEEARRQLITKNQRQLHELQSQLDALTRDTGSNRQLHWKRLMDLQSAEEEQRELLSYLASAHIHSMFQDLNLRIQVLEEQRKSRQLRSQTGDFGDEIARRDRTINQLRDRIADLTESLESVKKQGKSNELLQYYISTREALVRAMWEAFSKTVMTRRHLKSIFQLSTWKSAVEKHNISDEIGDAMCVVVEDIQWLHDRGHWMITHFLTDIEKTHMGTSPSFFSEEGLRSPRRRQFSPDREKTSSFKLWPNAFELPPSPR